ncbi:hypothetical protein WJX73_009607 [Symbiochloris irregularis]|uniref:ATP synthase subunit d, mitochondrial n=1 Tax=Symbiochloris irregularis TaxID=706552 RepID=A0AAW1NWX6_9CHLO
MALLLQSGRVGWRQIVAPGSAITASCSGHYREYAAAAPATSQEEDDVVLSVFKEQQRHYREFLKGMKNIAIPLNGDENAIKKYATEVEALKKKIGMPGVEETLSATLDYKMSVARYNVRKFISAATEGVELGEYAGVVAEVSKAVDEIEKETGAPLDASNDQGWDNLRKRLEGIQKQHGLDDYAKIKDEATLDMYKQQLAKIRQSAIDSMDAVKRKEGLDYINIDPANIKFKL